MRTTRSIALVLALIAPAAGHAQVTHSNHATGSALPAVQLGKPRDALSWNVLARVELVKRNGSFKPQFDRTVQGLDNAQVKVQGSMLPIEVGDRHQQFLLT